MVMTLMHETQFVKHCQMRVYPRDMNAELTFGEWLGDMLDRLGISNKELAQAVGVDPSTVSRWLDGNSRPRRSRYAALARALDVHRAELYRRLGEAGPPSVSKWHEQSFASPDYLQLEPVVQVPVIGTLPADADRWTAGIGTSYPLPASTVAGLESPRLYIVSGDCLLSRGLHHGDLVLLDRRASPRPGDIVAVRIGDDHTLKEWWPDEDGKHVTLRASEPGYRPILLRLDDDNNEVIGVARAWLRMGSFDR